MNGSRGKCAAAMSVKHSMDFHCVQLRARAPLRPLCVCAHTKVAKLSFAMTAWESESICNIKWARVVAEEALTQIACHAELPSARNGLRAPRMHLRLTDDKAAK